MSEEKLKISHRQFEFNTIIKNNKFKIDKIDKLPDKNYIYIKFFDTEKIFKLNFNETSNRQYFKEINSKYFKLKSSFESCLELDRYFEIVEKNLPILNFIVDNFEENIKNLTAEFELRLFETFDIKFEIEGLPDRKIEPAQFFKLFNNLSDSILSHIETIGFKNSNNLFFVNLNENYKISLDNSQHIKNFRNVLDCFSEIANKVESLKFCFMNLKKMIIILNVNTVAFSVDFLEFLHNFKFFNEIIDFLNTEFVLFLIELIKVPEQFIYSKNSNILIKLIKKYNKELNKINKFLKLVNL